MFQSTGSSLTIKSAASEEPPATANEASDDGRIITPYFGEISTYYRITTLIDHFQAERNHKNIIIGFTVENEKLNGCW